MYEVEGVAEFERLPCDDCDGADGFSDGRLELELVAAAGLSTLNPSSCNSGGFCLEAMYFLQQRTVVTRNVACSELGCAVS